MNEKTVTIQTPKWLKEISPTPQKYVKELFASIAFTKMKEYERQVEIFENKYHMSFDKFEKTINNLKKENFEMWDDYVIWKGLHLVHQKWTKRYQKI